MRLVSVGISIEKMYLSFDQGKKKGLIRGGKIGLLCVKTI